MTQTWLKLIALTRAYEDEAPQQLHRHSPCNNYWPVTRHTHFLSRENLFVGWGGGCCMVGRIVTGNM